MTPLITPMSRVLVQLVIDTVDEGLPARFDDIVRYADSAPAIFAVAGLDQYPHHGAGALPRREHADFIIQQLDLLERWIKFCQRATQRLVERVDGPIAHRRGVFHHT